MPQNAYIFQFAIRGVITDGSCYAANNEYMHS